MGEDDIIMQAQRLILSAPVAYGDEGEPTAADIAEQIEDEIGRRGLQEAYVRALVGGAEEATRRLWYCGVDDLWRVATATPEQRCRAALAAVGEG
jgi:hypothetical protein